jgi:hypothetical protein
MRNAIITILFFLSYINTFAQKKDSLLAFHNKVEWSSFRGVPNDDTLAARIATSINLVISKINVWNGSILFKSYAAMNPFASWVRPGYADEHTWQHEQTHFNITEVCARSLQAELNQMKLKSKKSPLIQATLKKWQTRMKTLQKQYDLETKGGNDPVAQNVWYQKILAELNNTD